MSDDEFDPKLYRDNPGAIAAYLDEVFRKNDLPEVLIALNQVMRAQNVKAMARETGLRRDNLYKTFGGEIDPQLGRVMALFEGLGVRLSVMSVKPKERPPRPKLGRPRISKPIRTL
ncbi:addiction module antidote protein [Bradyrhizobium sp. AUGA SZCCT0160]|uniref:addiction module antidote protein n=1 Tax=Bradyrhizobium sp. AUGA SZCCT0160 TaxID=2807662 RepID=UPI001BAB0F1F|nr:addiction module antidote protein [Bradyrhizobium sp. AUGA SZCCT0160]MBR1192686.1 putative addiction module antidote protein [Bradyrhizobium sp. AUGA SZCCT0160]